MTPFMETFADTDTDSFVSIYSPYSEVSPAITHVTKELIR